MVLLFRLQNLKFHGTIFSKSISRGENLTWSKIQPPLVSRESGCGAPPCCPCRRGRWIPCVYTILTGFEDLTRIRKTQILMLQPMIGIITIPYPLFSFSLIDVQPVPFLYSEYNRSLLWYAAPAIADCFSLHLTMEISKCGFGIFGCSSFRTMKNDRTFFSTVNVMRFEIYIKPYDCSRCLEDADCKFTKG